MKILNENNKVINLTNIIETEDDVYFSYFDFSNKQSIDCYYSPLVYIESFYSSSIELVINDSIVQLPYDWYILSGDFHSKDCEFVNLKHVNHRDFSAFVFNPITGFSPRFSVIEALNIYSSVKWFFPKLKQNTALCFPINEKDKPDCIFICPEVSEKNSIIDYTLLL